LCVGGWGCSGCAGCGGGGRCRGLRHRRPTRAGGLSTKVDDLRALVIRNSLAWSGCPLLGLCSKVALTALTAPRLCVLCVVWLCPQPGVEAFELGELSGMIRSVAAGHTGLPGTSSWGHAGACNGADTDGLAHPLVVIVPVAHKQDGVGRVGGFHPSEPALRVAHAQDAGGAAAGGRQPVRHAPLRRHPAHTRRCHGEMKVKTIWNEHYYLLEGLDLGE
jgi:hypothetical protein